MRTDGSLDLNGILLAVETLRETVVPAATVCAGSSARRAKLFANLQRCWQQDMGQPEPPQQIRPCGLLFPSYSLQLPAPACCAGKLKADLFLTTPAAASQWDLRIPLVPLLSWLVAIQGRKDSSLVFPSANGTRRALRMRTAVRKGNSSLLLLITHPPGCKEGVVSMQQRSGAVLCSWRGWRLKEILCVEIKAH